VKFLGHKFMSCYRLAGRDFSFPGLTIPELSLFGMKNTRRTALQPDPVSAALTCQTVGWVGAEQREVEVWSAHNGSLLKVRGGSDFFISLDGSCIQRISDFPSKRVEGLDREILFGPALVLALASRGVWCLHASAVICKSRLIVFLGESAQGKSTLAAYLAQADGRLVADDILPVTFGPTGMEAWPHFPQLKLSPESQPGATLAEPLPLDHICVLAKADANARPELQRLPAGQAAQSLLRHTAGARLFASPLLASHLEFCTKAGGQIPAFQLAYPHRRDALPLVKELLETVC
jgi:hypothetical protein